MNHAIIFRVLVLALSAASLAITGCSSDSPAAGADAGGGGGADAAGGGGEGPVQPPDPGFDYVFPFVAYTGYDGTNTYKVPFSTNLTENVTWEVADPTIASIVSVPAPEIYAEFGESWAMITTLKAGTTTVTAVSGATRVDAELIVAEYDPAVVAAGEVRYTAPANPEGAQRTACASCHAQANGVDHSPLELAFFQDADILSAITTGMYPATEEYDGYVLQGVNHMWNLDAAEQAGIVPYLRALAPRGF